MQKSEPVLENETRKSFRNLEIKTNHSVKARRAEIVIERANRLL